MAQLATEHPMCQRKPRADWKKELQICGAGGKSRKSPTLVVGKKPYGKSRINKIPTPHENLLSKYVPSLRRNLVRNLDPTGLARWHPSGRRPAGCQFHPTDQRPANRDPYQYRRNRAARNRNDSTGGVFNL